MVGAAPIRHSPRIRPSTVEVTEVEAGLSQEAVEQGRGVLHPLEPDPHQGGQLADGLDVSGIVPSRTRVTKGKHVSSRGNDEAHTGSGWSSTATAAGVRGADGRAR